MDNEAVDHLSDRKLPKNLIVEALDAEKQLWRLVHSKGLLHDDVRELYLKACSSYEKIILHDHELAELQDIEYSLWKLHYKHIDEYRNRRLRETMNLEMPKNASTAEQDNNNLLVEFKSFLSEATEFYQGLIKKIRRNNGLPEEILLFNEGGFSSQRDSTKMCRIQFSCHRCFVSLGDLARYRELYGNPDSQNRNWSIAATHYLNASMIWPDSGNPQNQLAVLATYVGDELLALYHCMRSLAVKEPFPDAWDNLILLFEKNRSSHLHSLSGEATFDFFKPSERSTVQFKAQSNDSSSMFRMREDTEDALPDKSGLWALIVRMISFFYIKSSLDKFPFVFDSVVRELEAMLSLDDAKLKDALESYQQMGIARRGPFRILQLVSILIFTIHTIGQSSKVQKHRHIKYMQQPDLIKLALASTFICMGCFVNRCMTTDPVEHSPLLPSILVFVECLVDTLDRAEAYVSDGKCANAISYFFSAFVDLLNHFSYAIDEAPDFIALWEDNELRGFSPIVQSHLSLNFTNCDEPRNGFEDKSESQVRISRIIAAAKKVVNRSNESHKWIFYDKMGGKFHVSVSEKLSGGTESEAVDHIPLLQEAKERRELEGGKDDQNKVDKSGDSSTFEEEEVILFKPITRYNSAPIYIPVTTTNVETIASIWDFKKPHGEHLNRGSSFPENQFCIDPSDFHSNVTSGSCSSKAFGHEPIPEDSEMGSFPEHSTDIGTADTKADGLPSVAGPPSLSAWVLNRENLGIGKGEGSKDSSKYLAGRNVDIASLSLTGLSIGETAVSLQDASVASSTSVSHFTYGSSSVVDSAIHPQFSSGITHHSLATYSPPMPSAPLLPNDASWYSGDSYSYDEHNNSEDITGPIAHVSQVNTLSNLSRTQDPPNYDLSTPRFSDAYTPLTGRTSSPQWHHQYQETLNTDRAHDHVSPFHLYTPTSLGRFQNHDVSRLVPDRWMSPSVSHSLQHLEDPPLHPGFHLNYGASEQRREKLFHRYQKIPPYSYGAVPELMSEQQLLLQYLKEKEWRVQHEAQLRGP